MPYKILRDDNLTALEACVNEHLKDNWEPLGGISAVSAIPYTLCFYQAVFKQPKHSITSGMMTAELDSSSRVLDVDGLHLSEITSNLPDSM